MRQANRIYWDVEQCAARKVNLIKFISPHSLKFYLYENLYPITASSINNTFSGLNVVPPIPDKMFVFIIQVSFWMNRLLCWPFKWFKQWHMIGVLCWYSGVAECYSQTNTHKHETNPIFFVRCIEAVAARLLQHHSV